jgi:hypothetical protein
MLLYATSLLLGPLEIDGACVAPHAAIPPSWLPLPALCALLSHTHQVGPVPVRQRSLLLFAQLLLCNSFLAETLVLLLLCWNGPEALPALLQHCNSLPLQQGLSLPDPVLHLTARLGCPMPSGPWPQRKASLIGERSPRWPRTAKKNTVKGAGAPGHGCRLQWSGLARMGHGLLMAAQRAAVLARQLLCRTSIRCATSEAPQCC